MKNIKQRLVSLCCLFILFSICNFFYFQNSGNYGVLPGENTKFEDAAIEPDELFNQTWSLIKSSYFDDDMNEQNWARWKKRYSHKIKTEEDAYIAINTMLASLNDPYSKFLNKNEFEEQNTTIDSKIYGIGINIVSISGKIYIMSVIKGAPADIQGVKSGDMILKINGNDIKGGSIFQAANYIKTGPNGSENKDNLVELEILRNGEKIIKKINKILLLIR